MKPAAVGLALVAGGQVGWLVLAGPAGAVDGSLGEPGFCREGDGVTVVVDFQDLGGDTLVRCAPGSQTRTGLEVLQDAGFRVDGVQRWGEGFVCRIENRPAATEQLPLTGDEDYREACIDTPPAGAFWGYWLAQEGGAWQYSQAGVKNSEVAPGGFAGWSFSLNAAGDANPAPGVAPEWPDGPDGSPADATTGNAAGMPDGGDKDRAGVGEAGSDEPWRGGAQQTDAGEPAGAGSVWSSAAGLAAVAGIAGLTAALTVRRRRRPPPVPMS